MARAQLGLGLSPMRQELHLAPGAQQSGTLTVTNGSPGTLRIRAELFDFFIDREATPQFARTFPQEAPYSCREWLSVNPMEWEQAPGTNQMVRYSVRVPAGAAVQSFHCGIGFTALPPASEAKGMGLRMTVRAITALYVFVGNPAPQGTLKSVALEPSHDPKEPGYRAVVVIENSSATVLRPSGEIAVLDAQGAVVESHPLATLPVLPRREQRLLVPLEHLVNQGRYTLRARVDIGTGEIQEGVAVVTARPPEP